MADDKQSAEKLLEAAIQLTPKKDRKQLLEKYIENDSGEEEAVSAILDDLMRKFFEFCQKFIVFCVFQKF